MPHNLEDGLSISEKVACCSSGMNHKTLSTAETKPEEVSNQSLRSSPRQREQRPTINTNIIRLHMRALHLPILHNKRIPLTPEVPQQGTRVEVQVEGFDELPRGVGDVADAGGVGGVKGLAPSLHDEGVVDGDDEDFAR